MDESHDWKDYILIQSVGNLWLEKENISTHFSRSCFSFERTPTHANWNNAFSGNFQMITLHASRLRAAVKMICWNQSMVVTVKFDFHGTGKLEVSIPICNVITLREFHKDLRIFSWYWMLTVHWFPPLGSLVHGWLAKIRVEMFRTDLTVFCRLLTAGIASLVECRVQKTTWRSHFCEERRRKKEIF